MFFFFPSSRSWWRERITPPKSSKSQWRRRRWNIEPTAGTDESFYNSSRSEIKTENTHHTTPPLPPPSTAVLLLVCFKCYVTSQHVHVLKIYYSSVFLGVVWCVANLPRISFSTYVPVICIFPLSFFSLFSELIDCVAEKGVCSKWLDSLDPMLIMFRPHIEQLHETLLLNILQRYSTAQNLVQ